MSNEKDELNFDEEFGDLLGDAQVTPAKPEPAPAKPAVAPAPSANPAPVAQAPAATATPDNNGFIPFGQKVSSVPIPRFRATKDSKCRVAIISKNVLGLKTHYVEGLGTIRCFDGKCCELEGMARVRYILPVVQYECRKDGSIISDALELKGLVLGAEQYDALASAVQFSGREINDVDIVITCSDEQYQKITFAADASKGATWKTFGAPAKAIADLYRANKDKLYMCIARNITPETYLTHKGFVGNAQPRTIPVNDINDLGLDD